MDPSVYYRKAPIVSQRKSDPPGAEPESKISSEFDLLMDEGKPNDVYDAIIIHHSPENDEKVNERTERQDIQTRQAMVGKWSEIHRVIQSNIFERYLYHSEKISGAPPLNVRSIGNGIFPMARVDVTRETLPYLAEIPEVTAVMPNHEVELIEAVSVKYTGPLYSEIKAGITWGLEVLGIPKMWEVTKGRGVNVAVLDTGVDGNHPALRDRVKNFVFIDSHIRRKKKRKGFDKKGHGTHVCGTIAGLKTPDKVAIGVAPEVELNVAAIPFGRSKGTFTSEVLETVSWAIQNQSEIINMSFGLIKNYSYPKLSNSFNRIAQQYGIIPVAAIGNQGYGRSGFPGNAYCAFAVGSVGGRPGMMSVSEFSGGASLVFPGHSTHEIITKPDVVAPGEYVYSCIPPQKKFWKTIRYANNQGTSMAAPHVAGSVALLMSALPKVPPADIVKALKQTAFHPGGDKRPDNRWGYGLIQPYEAYRALG